MGEINLSSDNYCYLADYHKGQFFMDGYYHTICYTTAIKTPVMKKAEELLNRAGEMIGLKKKDKIINI